MVAVLVVVVVAVIVPCVRNQWFFQGIFLRMMELAIFLLFKRPFLHGLLQKLTLSCTIKKITLKRIYLRTSPVSLSRSVSLSVCLSPSLFVSVSLFLALFLWLSLCLSLSRALCLFLCVYSRVATTAAVAFATTTASNNNNINYFLLKHTCNTASTPYFQVVGASAIFTTLHVVSTHWSVGSGEPFFLLSIR